MFSIVWCCARCLCCGLTCCCECISCLSCFSGRKKQPRYAEGPPPLAPYQGYQPAPAPPRYEPSRFATFDAPSKGPIHEDSLPAMPSWDTASTRRVEDAPANNDMEMGRLAQHGSRTGRGGYSQVSDQPPSPYGNGRGADMTHAYASDLGAQRQGAEGGGYGGYSSGAAPASPFHEHQPYSDRSPGLGSVSYGGGPPSYRTTPQSEYQAPTFSAPGPMNVSPSQVRPPSLLQVGRRPVPGSGREV